MPGVDFSDSFSIFAATATVALAASVTTRTVMHCAQGSHDRTQANAAIDSFVEVAHLADEFALVIGEEANVERRPIPDLITRAAQTQTRPLKTDDPLSTLAAELLDAVRNAKEKTDGVKVAALEWALEKAAADQKLLLRRSRDLLEILNAYDAATPTMGSSR